MTFEGTEKLLAWYDVHRRILPWREDPTPYHVWVSEIMLQQTRVEVVVEYYLRFMTELPTVEALADVSEDRLLKLWQGLGYYSRARNLHRTAQILKGRGAFPETEKELLKLPGIGPYSAGAILSIAFGKPVIAADGNAYRIAARVLADEGILEESQTRKRLENALQEALSEERPGEFNQALMDLGSGICLSHGKPRCQACPLATYCEGMAQGIAAQLPHRRAKGKRKVEEKDVFIFRRGERILLVKRARKGLLANLWGLPMCDASDQEDVDQQARDASDQKKSDVEMEKAERDLWNLSVDGQDAGDEVAETESHMRRAVDDVAAGVSLGQYQHVFSHVTWRMHGYLYDDVDEVFLKHLAEANIEYTWASADELASVYSIPAAFWPFLSQISTV